MRSDIIYIGPLQEGGTCLDRKRALEQLGFDVQAFDVASYRSSARILASIEGRLHIGPSVVNLNRDVRAFVMRRPNAKIIWFDRVTWIWPETLQEIRRSTTALLLHYTPDAQLVFNRSRHFNACIPIFDAVITTKRFERDLYKRYGARQVIATWQSFDRDRFYPRRSNPEYATDVGLIGHYERHYARVASAARMANACVSIRGPGWSRTRARPRLLKECVKGNGLWGEEYAIALSSARIGLGVLSKWFPERHTTRSVEIPASGSMLLAERTEEHQELFREGHEAEFFSDLEELRDKIGYYLRNEPLRAQIAARGRERCIQGGYDNVSRLEQVIRQIPDS